jgi:acetoacetate decarboxylase
VAEPWRGAPPHGATLDAETAVSGPFSFPWDAPLVPPFPIRFRDVSILTVCWRTDPQALARFLPPPLEPVGDVAVTHIYRMPDTDFAGSLHECNVMFGARMAGPDEIVEGGYSMGLHLDSDVGVAHGREAEPHDQPAR